MAICLALLSPLRLPLGHTNTHTHTLPHRLSFPASPTPRTRSSSPTTTSPHNTNKPRTQNATRPIREEASTVRASAAAVTMVVVAVAVALCVGAPVTTGQTTPCQPSYKNIWGGEGGVGRRTRRAGFSEDAAGPGRHDQRGGHALGDDDGDGGLRRRLRCCCCASDHRCGEHEPGIDLHCLFSLHCRRGSEKEAKTNDRG